MPQCYCEKCGRTLDSKNFYKSNNLEKYPSGYLNQCKKCLTMHVDNWDPNTYLWILQECDVPYVPDSWNKILSKYLKDKKSVTGATIIGRYLSTMRINQFKNYRWKDTEYLQEKQKLEIESTMRSQGFDEQEIDSVISKGVFQVPDKPLQEPKPQKVSAEEFAAGAITTAPPRPENLATGQEDYFAEQAGETDIELDLTEEDKTYLRLKWGKGYKPDEWVQLEKLYDEMMQSYDIQTAGHIDTLKLICKTSLKANQLIDLGDVESFQKMSKVYDSLMKAGRFTAAQNKAEQGEFVDAVGELVVICEKEGFIPRYYISQPNDMVDETIRDMQRYTSTLIKEETNLSQLLEDAVKIVQKEDIEEEKERLANTDAEDDDDDLNDINEIEREIKEGEEQITTSDYDEFNDFLESEELADELALQALSRKRAF